MVRRFLGLTLGLVLAPVALSAAPISVQRAAPPAPPPVLSAPALPPHLTTPALPTRLMPPVVPSGFISPFVPPRFVGTRPFFRHHHHLFFFPVAFTDGLTRCEEAALFAQHAVVSPVGGSRDVAVAYIDQVEAATALLYGLRAAGYQEVQLVSLQFEPDSVYRAEFRLGRRDASLC